MNDINQVREAIAEVIEVERLRGFMQEDYVKFSRRLLTAYETLRKALRLLKNKVLVDEARADGNTTQLERNMAEVIEAVEFVNGVCPWCRACLGFRSMPLRYEHEIDCKREQVLKEFDDIALQRTEGE